jgi:hypothetical protein
MKISCPSQRPEVMRPRFSIWMSGSVTCCDC